MRKINFLLVGINAKYIHLNLALYSLKYSVDESLRSHVTTAEYTINHVYEQILQDIFRRKPDVIGISCYIWNMEVVKRLCSDLAKILPGVPVWLGGPEAAGNPGIFASVPEITGVMYGEGETAFPGLLREYLEYDRNSDGNMEDERAYSWDDRLRDKVYLSPGLRYRLPDGSIFDTGMAQEPDMDDLPFIYNREEDYSNRIVYYESSRGCPFHCSYCLAGSSRKVRYRSLDLVLPELQWFLDHQIPQVKFLDRTFNSNHQRTITVWRYLAEHDNGITNFHFEITADLLNEEEIQILGQMRPGLIQLEIGVQTTNPQTLEAINRRTDFEQLKSAVSAIGSWENVHQHLDLIAGLPFEDMENFIRSFNDVYRLKPSQLQLGFLKVLNSSPIFGTAGEYGIVYQERPPYEVLFTRWLSYEDIICLKGVEEMVETYYNSHQFELTLKALERFFDSPFALYAELSAYCRRVNPSGKSLSRNSLYEQLQGFIHEISVNCQEVFDTLLTMDYYLREHARKRPVFAVGREIPWPGHSRDYHREEIGFDLELFMKTGEVKGGTEQWIFDYTARSAISGNAGLKKEDK